MNTKLTVYLLGLMLMVTPNAGAEEGAVEETNLEVPAGPVKVGNKICPISGEKVGEMGDVVEYEYNGKIYNFCCPMCLKDFKKDPEKYVKMVEDMMAQEAAEGETPEGHMDQMHDHQHE